MISRLSVCSDFIVILIKKPVFIECIIGIGFYFDPFVISEKPPRTHTGPSFGEMRKDKGMNAQLDFGFWPCIEYEVEISLDLIRDQKTWRYGSGSVAGRTYFGSTDF